MEALINRLFPKTGDQDAILSFLASKDEEGSIYKAIGQRLMAESEPVFCDPMGQFLATVSLAPFSRSVDEYQEIAKIMMWGLRNTDILPELITHHGGKALAYRCLLSLAFYKEHMKRRTERRGAPSPKFYRQIGVKSFYNIGMKDISEHFENWETFLPEVFA